MQPKVSIVIPEYHEKRESIKNCLQALSFQTISDYEVIIVSYVDRITRGSVKLIDIDMDDNVKFVTTMIRGIGHARCSGVAQSRGQYIVNMDIDAQFLEKNAIEKLIKPLELGVAKMTHCNAILNPEEPREFEYADLVYKIRNDLASHIMIPQIIEQGLCFRKSDYDILPEGFRNVPINEGGVLAFEFALAYGFPSIMKVEDVHVVTSARRINKLATKNLLDVFNYDNAWRT